MKTRRDKLEKRFTRADPPRVRFIAQLSDPDENECINWLGSKLPTGYGRMMYKGKRTVTNRISWELYRGSIPDGMHVLHHCDNPSCVNPDHLYLGTHQDNMRDRKIRNRTYRAVGEKHPMAKLTSDAVIDMKIEMTAGMTPREAAQKYNITVGQAHAIRRGDSWKHLHEG